ncbi:MAG: hypothetical protein IPI45_14370 [Saprospiraceae bacterium]|nr:hypothetical protein [Saprospiraceae bacterium]
MKTSERESFTDLNFVSPIRGPSRGRIRSGKGHLGVDIIAPKKHTD